MPDLHSLAVFVLQFSQKWAQALAAPTQFLSPGFQPTSDQIVQGLEFYFGILGLSLLIYAPFILGSGKGELGEKAQLLSITLVGLSAGAMVAVSWHFVFWLFGGQSDFAGTYLAYIYSAGPIAPLITISSVIIFSALPPDLRKYALSPATAQKAFQLGLKDPRTSNAKIIFGGLLSFLLMVYSIIIQFSSMRFVQNVSGWRLVPLVFLLIIVTMIVGVLFQSIQGAFYPSFDDGEPPQATRTDVALISPEVVNAFNPTQVQPSNPEAQETPL